MYVCVCVSQDPQTIEHEQAESGALYATPQKKKGNKEKKKKDQAEADVDEGAAVAALYSIPDKKGQKEKSTGVSNITLDTLVTRYFAVMYVYFVHLHYYSNSDRFQEVVYLSVIKVKRILI